MLWCVEEGNLQKLQKKSQKLLVFKYKIQSKALTKNLRHASLDKNVFYTCLKVGICRSNMKRDIDVQKIKVEKSLINSLLS